MACEFAFMIITRNTTTRASPNAYYQFRKIRPERGTSRKRVLWGEKSGGLMHDADILMLSNQKENNTTMPIYEQPAQLLQRLIRFDTTNPPGNEVECIRFIQGMLEEVGVSSTIVAKDEQRPNLIARLKGRGSAAPLLLQGHVDVVTTAHQEWKYPPF